MQALLCLQPFPFRSETISTIYARPPTSPLKNIPYTQLAEIVLLVMFVVLKKNTKNLSFVIKTVLRHEKYIGTTAELKTIHNGTPKIF